MSMLDWLVLLLFLAYTIWDGMRRHGGAKSVDDQFLAGRNMAWWGIGISVLATQASAATFIGTTGQAFFHDMRFVQFYFGMPIAMVILAVTLVPLYHKIKAYTAYQLLEDRFGLKVRLAASFIFLLSRGLATGLAIVAPAIVLTFILNLALPYTILIIGLVATVYTVFGGIGGVIRTDIKQMGLMLFGLAFCLFWILHKLPENVGMGEALEVAGALGKLETIDINWDLQNKYSIWSGMLAGTFLMLAYFGTDQAQVQRYLTAKNATHAKLSLILPAFVKVPMQFMILLIGALLYVFYVFTPSPPAFSQEYFGETIPAEAPVEAFNEAHAERKNAAFAYLAQPSNSNKTALRDQDTVLRKIHKGELNRLEALSQRKRNDTNFVLPYFMLHEMPPGILGLIIAAIFAAALSSLDSLLNSLAASSVMDWYCMIRKGDRSPEHDLKAARIATAFWGVVATSSALAFGETESIVELVNKVGSYFYGPLLGVFALLWVKRASGTSALIGLIGGILLVILCSMLYQNPDEQWQLAWSIPKGSKAFLSYLWLNPLGAGLTILLGWGLGKKRDF
ncbi:MAG: sodium-coupled permease [Bacteroidia bacterium]